ncbi:hypothetical protein Efla_000243 [Eimeria flavescens]
MFPSYTSMALGRSFTSESAFMDGAADIKATETTGARLMLVEGGALRTGILEKATKDASAWKPRRCTLHAEAFWYSKEVEPDAKGSKDGTAPRRKWTCIPLLTCVQLLRWPDDGRVFLVQTESRSYHWRAKSQNEAEAWLLSIGTQRANMKEDELLREAEIRICRTEEAHTDACLDFLHSLYRLEGTLRFRDTRELLSGFLVDFFRSQAAANAPGESGDQKTVAEWSTGSQCAAEGLGKDVRRGRDVSSAPSNSSVTPHSGHGVNGSGFTFEKVQKFFEVWAGSEPESHLSEDSEFRGIGEWLRVEVFPQFISSPIIQRRVAQLAASRSVVNWGIDPLKSPLLTPNIFDTGSQQPFSAGVCGPLRSSAWLSAKVQH